MLLLLFIFNSYKYHRMQPKHIKKNKAIADQIKIVNYAHQNSIHMAVDKYGVETKSIRNWRKKTVAGVTKDVRQIYQKYSSSCKKSRNWWSRKWNSWLDINQ